MSAYSDTASSGIEPATAFRVVFVRLHRVVRLVLAALAILGAVALGALAATERLEDDLEFRPPAPTENGLASVDMAVALIEREERSHAWVANEPPPLPGYWLRNMAAYQQGIIYALSRFSFELADTLGRARGATAVDPDLDRAAGLLRFPGDVWVFDFEKTWTPVVTSEEQYLAAARALAQWNERLAAGQAMFDPRPDSLHTTLARIEADISSKANVLVEQVERLAAGLPVTTRSTELFYNTKGRLYAYALVLEALGEDFAEVIEREGLGLVWSRMLGSLRNAAALHPFVVTDYAPGSLLAPSHTDELGFFLLRAHKQLRDAMTVLREV